MATNLEIIIDDFLYKEVQSFYVFINIQQHSLNGSLLLEQLSKCYYRTLSSLSTKASY